MALLPLSGSARTIVDLFAIEPGNIFPLLTRTSRLDMVDYYNSGQQVAVPNNLAGEARLLELDSAYLKVQTSGSRVVEIHWQRYTSDKIFTKPGIDDFIVRKMPGELRADLQDAMIFPLVQLTFTGENHDVIEATHGLEQFLVPSEYKRFGDYLKPSLSFRFKGLKIIPVK